MARSPRYKVYTAHGEYVACAKHPSDAGAVASLYGDGATIRDGHTRIVWTEGTDGYAGDSFDYVAIVVLSRE